MKCHLKLHTDITFMGPICVTTLSSYKPFVSSAAILEVQEQKEERRELSIEPLSQRDAAKMSALSESWASELQYFGVPG